MDANIAAMHKMAACKKATHQILMQFFLAICSQPCKHTCLAVNFFLKIIMDIVVALQSKVEQVSYSLPMPVMSDDLQINACSELQVPDSVECCVGPGTAH